MNWDAIGAIGEIIGAVAVIVSIIYLAMQVRQNLNLVRGSGYQAAAQTANHILGGWSSNPDSLRVFITAQESYPELNREEMALAHTHFLQIINMYESLYYQYQAGVLDSNIWEGRQLMLSNFLAMPGFAAWWEEWRHIYGSNFLAYVEEHCGAGTNSSLHI
jgi:hypothetical protein